MREIAPRQSRNLAVVPTYSPASGDVKALIEVAASGVFLSPRDLTPVRVAAMQQQLADATAALSVAPLLGIKTWLGNLAQLVTNPPNEQKRGDAVRAIVEVCGDLPIGVWTPETRIAWTRQKPRDGYPVGARWPSPAELYQHLEPFARRIRGEQASLRRLLAKAEQAPEPERKPPTEDAKKYVRELAAKFRGEVAAREAENARRV